MRAVLLTISIILSGCTLHVCGNSEVAHQVGNGTIGEQQQNEDSAELEAEVPVK